MNSLQKSAALSALFCGGALPLFGDEEAKEWWAPLAMGARPVYEQIKPPEEGQLSNAKPLFDDDGRLWTSGSAAHLYDGFRWQTYALDEELAYFGTRHYEASERRLWIADAARFGYIALDTLGYPLNSTAQWLEPFPHAKQGANPWFVDRFRGAESLRFVFGGDLYIRREGKTSKVIETDDPILFPFAQGEAVGWGDKSGQWRWISADGTITPWRHPEIDTRIHWIRRNHFSGDLEGVSIDHIFTLSRGGQVQVEENPGPQTIFQEAWSVGAVQSEKGWTGLMSHAHDMLIYPAASLAPYAAPTPRTATGAEPSRINQVTFDDASQNLWLATMQGLYKWENPGLSWRWLDSSQTIKQLKKDPSGLLVVGSTRASYLDLKNASFEQISDPSDLFFDTTITADNYLFATRGHVYKQDQSSLYLPDKLVQDLFFIFPLGGADDDFVAFGQNNLFIGSFEADQMTPIVGLDSLVSTAVKQGERYAYGLADGSVFELTLSADTAQPALVANEQLRAADGSNRTRKLVTVGDSLLLLSGGELSILDRSRKVFVPVDFPDGSTVLATTELSPTTALCLLARKGSDQTFYATVALDASSPEIDYVWYPGEASVGQVADLAYVPESEHVFVGGSKGLISFQRDLLKAFEEIAPFRLEASLDERATWARIASSAPRLPYDASQIQFRWYQPHWSLNPPIQFESKLGGVHAEWTTTELAEREFTGLREGRYSFSVRARTPIGTMLHEQVFEFIVLPPWYRSTAAYIVYGLLLLLAGYAGARLYSLRESRRRAHLERVVRKRTAELEAANKTKAEFVASMSHELRNPINGVVGISELLERSELSAESKDLVGTLRSCTAQLGAMIDDVLDFARIEAGQLSLQKRPFNLPAMINRVVEVTHWDARQSTHTVHLSTEGTAPALVIGDDSKISQILINFINNACKYTEPGEIRLHGRFEITNSHRLSLRIDVEDGGPGMSNEERARVFEKFYRSPRAANSPIRGTGLGLSVCSEIAELMGGEVAVSPNDRGGSTFSLKLRLHLPEGGITAALEDFEATYTGSALVVDDMDYNRLVAAGLLESLGFSVTSVSTGREAIDELIRADYDFAFLDYELADSTGPQILQAVKEEKPHLATKCFAVTAYTTEEVKQRCLGAGFRGHLSKPITRIGLHEALIGSGLHPDDLARGSYRQTISDPVDQSFDLEPLLLLAGGSMKRMMECCEDYLSILHTEVASLEQLIEGDQPSETLILKRLHRLVSHAAIVKAHAFILQIEAMQTRVRSTPSDQWPLAFEALRDSSRELALNLRRIVDEYRSDG